MLKRCLTFSSQTSLCDIDLAYLKPWHPFLAHNLNGPWLIVSLDILYTVCAQQHLLQYAHEHIHNSHTCTNKDNVESVSQRCEKGGKKSNPAVLTCYSPFHFVGLCVCQAHSLLTLVQIQIFYAIRINSVQSSTYCLRFEVHFSYFETNAKCKV